MGTTRSLRSGRRISLRSGRRMRRLAVAVAGVALVLSPVPAQASGGAGRPGAGYGGLTASQQATLPSVARDTWNFYHVDVDPGTHLPLDNITFAGGPATPTGYGRFTAAVPT